MAHGGNRNLNPAINHEGHEEVGGHEDRKVAKTYLLGRRLMR
jgi:hypothetical protein